MSDKETIIFNTESPVNEPQQKQIEIPIAALVPETSPALTEVMPPYDFNNQVMGDIKSAQELASILVESCKQYNGLDRKSTRLNSSHIPLSRMPSSA